MYNYKSCMPAAPPPFYPANFVCRATIIMVELSWSQTPSSVWWALETGTAASNLSLDNILSPPTPNKLAAGSGSRKRTLQHQLTNPTIFYNSIDETDSGERDEDLEHWVSEDPSRGIIRSAPMSYIYKIPCQFKSHDQLSEC